MEKYHYLVRVKDHPERVMFVMSRRRADAARTAAKDLSTWSDGYACLQVRRIFSGSRIDDSGYWRTYAVCFRREICGVEQI